MQAAPAIFVLQVTYRVTMCVAARASIPAGNHTSQRASEKAMGEEHMRIRGSWVPHAARKYFVFLKYCCYSFNMHKIKKDERAEIAQETGLGYGNCQAAMFDKEKNNVEREGDRGTLAEYPCALSLTESGMLQILFAGLFVKVEQIPVWIRWAQVSRIKILLSHNTSFALPVPSQPPCSGLAQTYGPQYSHINIIRI